jgi:hypothetical protein
MKNNFLEILFYKMNKFFKLILLQYVNCNEYYEWTSVSEASKSIEKYPNGNIICRAPISVKERNIDIELAGEVIDNQCLLGSDFRNNLYKIFF